jgi:hypothetical protein
MTSEKRFALSHSGFWNALLPMEETYIRAHNARLNSFSHPLASLVPADQRGVVNECAFLLFVSALKDSVLPSDLPRERVAQCANEAMHYISRMRQFSRVPPTPITEMGMRDAKVLASRLSSYFNSKPWQLLCTKPFFPGCGWVDDAEGDVLGDHTLFEIKAGERQFRGTDVRQLLCYCSLSVSAKVYDITTICLINPRSGTYFQDSLETLCQKTAGMSAADVLGEIVNYVSEPFSRYRTG